MAAHTSRSWIGRATARVAIGLLLAPTGPASHAAPVGEQIERGDASVERDGSITRITAGDGTRIGWDAFGIGSGETVLFVQPSRDSKVFNFDRSGLPSPVDGTMLANGIVYLVNPAGVFVGQQAVIDVGGLVAAAGRLSAEDFAAGLDRFTALSGAVENRGAIRAGRVALVGRSVANHGEILAPAGTIALVAGGEVLLTRPEGRVLVRAEPAPEDPSGFAVENTGTLGAARGEVVLAAGDLYSLALNHSGITSGGRIRLEGGAGGVVRVSGRLDAASGGAGETGGRVEVLGELVALEDAGIDASGPAGGGEVRIGGELRGAEGLPRADRTYVDRDTRIAADATASGDGGSIAVGSAERTAFFGRASARGGPDGGDGGFVDLSGPQLEVGGEVELAAPRGTPGTLLYDPNEIEILGGLADGLDAGADPDALAEDVLFGATVADPFRIFESELEGAARRVILEAEQRIFASGSFDHERASEGPGVLLLSDGLELRTRNGAASASAGIDLMTGSDLVEIRNEGASSLLIASGNADGPPGERGDEVAPIRVGGLTARGGAVLLATRNGSIAVEGPISTSPQAEGMDAGDVRVLAALAGGDSSGDVSVTGDIEARGADAVNGAGGRGGQVLVQSVRGAISVAGVRSTGGSGSSADAPADGGDGNSVTVQTGAGAVTVGAIDSSGGAALGAGGGAAGQPGDIAVAADLQPPAASIPMSPILLAGTLTALAGAGGGSSEVSVRVTGVGEVSALGAGPHIRTGGDVLLQGDAIGAGSPIRIEGGGQRERSLEVLGFGEIGVEVTTPGFADLRVVQSEPSAEVLVTQGDLATPGAFDRIDLDGGADAATIASLEAHPQSRITLRLDDAIPTENPPSATLVVPSGSVLARGDVTLRSDGDLVLGTPGGGAAAVDASGGGAVVLRADFDDEGGGDLLVEPLAGGVAAIRAGGDLRLAGRGIGSASQPVRVEGVGAAGLLSVNPSGAAHVDPIGTPFATLEVVQRDANGDVVMRIGVPDAEGQFANFVGIGGAPGLSALQVNTSGSTTSFVYRLADPGATLAVATGAALLGGEALLESAGDLELGTGPGVALVMANGSPLTLRADTDSAGGGAIRSGGGAIDLGGGAGVPGTLFLEGRGIGTASAPGLLSGGGTVSAESQGGGIALQNEGGGELVAAHVAHSDPVRGDPLEIDDAGVPSEDAIRIRAASEALVLENAAGGLRLAAPVSTTGDARFSAAAVALAGTPSRPLVDARDQTYEGPVAVAASSRLRSSGALLFRETIDAAAGAGTSSLVLDVGGELALGDGAGTDEVGGTMPLASLATTGAGSARIWSAAIATSGDQSHGLAVSVEGLRTAFTSQSGAISFADGLEGPGAAAVAAAGRSTFDGDVGGLVPVEALEVSAGEIDFAGSRRVAAGAGGIALDPAGRASVPEVATALGHSDGLRFETSGDFALGRREKLAVPGRLEIAADEVRAGDLSALDIAIQARSYTILGREPGLVRLANGASVADEGVDVVANSIVLSTAPAFDGVGRKPQLFASGDSVRAPGGFDVVELRTLGDRASLGRSDFFEGGGATVLDLTGNGGALVVNPAQEVPRQPVRVAELHAPELGETAPKAARRVDAAGLSARLRGETVDATRFDDEILDSPRAAELAAGWQALFAPGGSADAAIGSLRRAIDEFRRRQPRRELASVDFRRFLAAAPERAPALTFLERLGALLGRLALLNVEEGVRDTVSNEVLDEALARLRVEGLTREQLEGATGARDRGAVL